LSADAITDKAADHVEDADAKQATGGFGISLDDEVDETPDDRNSNDQPSQKAERRVKQLSSLVPGCDRTISSAIFGPRSLEICVSCSTLGRSALFSDLARLNRPMSIARSDQAVSLHL